jgi:hypothetical protein
MTKVPPGNQEEFLLGLRRTYPQRTKLFRIPKKKEQVSRYDDYATPGKEKYGLEKERQER